MTYCPTSCGFYNENSNKWIIDDSNNFYKWKDFYYGNWWVIANVNKTQYSIDAVNK